MAIPQGTYTFGPENGTLWVQDRRARAPWPWRGTIS